MRPGPRAERGRAALLAVSCVLAVLNALCFLAFGFASVASPLVKVVLAPPVRYLAA